MSWNVLYIIDLFSISLFAISYYRNCYRKGYRVDIWHAQLMLFCVVPYMLMLPFTRSELNSLVVGRDFAGFVAAVPAVFPITIAGFIAIFLGGSLWNLRVGMGARKAAAQLLNLGPQCSMMLMSSRSVLVFLSLLCFLCQALTLAAYFASSGFGFDLRAYTFSHPGIRPVVQIVALSSVVIASHCLARYVELREKVLLACTLLLSFGLAFFGQRTNIALVFINVALCYLVQRRNRISLFRIITLTTILIALVFYLGNVREGKYSLGDFFASIAFLAFYGNNFCDLRDFAWIYSDWNHRFWLGKTYLAGLATFVPRGASEFRGTWSFGIATDWTVGLDTQLHPGLKPGQFGEAFFNFGWLGAIGVGLVFGFILRRVDTDVKAALQPSHPSMIRAFASTMLLSVAVCFNSSLALPSLYALFGIYILAWFCLRVLALVRPQRALASEAH